MYNVSKLISTIIFKKILNRIYNFDTKQDIKKVFVFGFNSSGNERKIVQNNRLIHQKVNGIYDGILTTIIVQKGGHDIFTNLNNKLAHSRIVKFCVVSSWGKVYILL